jgi:hypothetical protein
MVEVTLKKWGNSLGVVLSKELKDMAWEGWGDYHNLIKPNGTPLCFVAYSWPACCSEIL